MAARDPARLSAAADELSAQGGKVVAVPTDITRQDQVDQLIAHTIDASGRLDALVNCAGLSSRGRILETTPEEFQRLFELNVFAVARCTRAAMPHLLKTRGHVVNIGSLSGKSASRYLGAYPASKFALAAYTQQLRLELAPEGVHVLLVSPGPIARDDGGRRYHELAGDLPEQALKPGGGVRLGGIAPEKLARRILRACGRRQPELVVPRRAKLLFALQQLSPRLGDWLLRKMT